MAGSGHKLQFLESVRGVAALAVVFHHLTLTFWPWVLDPGSDQMAAAHPLVRAAAGSPLSVAIDGRTPVLVFFVLSGFVLATSHLRAAAGSQAAAAAAATSAAARRYVRLTGPILASALLSYGLIRAHAYPTRGVVALVPGSWLIVGYTFAPALFDPLGGPLAQGLYGVLLNLGGPTYDNVLWTMPVELAGSFLVFAFLALFGSARRRWAVYAAVGFGMAMTEQTYMLQFLLGTFLCDAYLTAGPRRVAARGELRWTVWPLLVIAAALAAHRRIDLRGFDRLPWRPYHATVAAGLFVALPLVSAPLRRVLDARPLVWLGRVSFGLYLMHALVIASAGAAVYLRLRQRSGWSHDAAAWTATGVSLVASLAAGWAFLHAVDRPSVAAARWVAAVIIGPPTSGTAAGAAVAADVGSPPPPPAAVG